MGIDWKLFSDRAAGMTDDALNGAIADCLATLDASDAMDRELGTDQGGKYRDEISVYRREIADREKAAAKAARKAARLAKATPRAGDARGSNFEAARGVGSLDWDPTEA